MAIVLIPHAVTPGAQLLDTRRKVVPKMPSPEALAAARRLQGHVVEAMGHCSVCDEAMIENACGRKLTQSTDVHCKDSLQRI